MIKYISALFFSSLLLAQFDQHTPIASEACILALQAMSRSATLKESLVEGKENAWPMNGITDLVPDKLGMKYRVTRTTPYGDWFSVYAPTGFDPQGSPLFTLLLFGNDHEKAGPLAKVLGYDRFPSKDVWKDSVYIPSTERLNSGIKELNAHLPKKESIAVSFYEQDKLNIDEYIERFAKNYELPIAKIKFSHDRMPTTLPVRDGETRPTFLHAMGDANHYFHDVYLHAGSIVIPRKSLDYFNVQLKTHIAFLSWLKKQEPLSLLNKEGQDLVRQVSNGNTEALKKNASKLLSALAYENKFRLAVAIDLITGSLPIGYHNEVGKFNKVGPSNGIRQFHASIKRLADVGKPFIDTDDRVGKNEASAVMKQIFNSDKNAFHFFNMERLKEMENQFFYEYSEEARAYITQKRDDTVREEVCLEIVKYRELLMQTANKIQKQN